MQTGGLQGRAGGAGEPQGSSWEQAEDTDREQAEDKDWEQAEDTDSDGTSS